MTNKLVVIINSLKVPKIKNMLLCEMKFLVPNYSCLQNHWLGGYHPQIPVLSVLCPQLNLLNPPHPPNKIPGYTTEHNSLYIVTTEVLMGYLIPEYWIRYALFLFLCSLFVFSEDGGNISHQNCTCLSNCSVTSQTTVVFLFTAVRSSHPVISIQCELKLSTSISVCG